MCSWDCIQQTGEAMLANMSQSKNLINFPKLWQDYRLAVKPASMYHGRLCATERDFISRQVGNERPTPKSCEPFLFYIANTPVTQHQTRTWFWLTDYLFAGSDMRADRWFISCHVHFITQPLNKSPSSHSQQGRGSAKIRCGKALSQHYYTEHVTFRDCFVCNHITHHKTNQ